MKEQLDIGTLAALVIRVASIDTTESSASDPRVGWNLDQQFQNIERVLINDGKPEEFAELGRQVLAEVGDLPEAAALSQIAIFNGERRRPATDDRKQMLLTWAAELDGSIGNLPDGPKKRRCLSLFQYNQGVFYNAYGLFSQAADLQRQSALAANQSGDTPGAAIGFFLGEFYNLKDRLADDKTMIDEFENIFGQLEDRYGWLVDAVRGTTQEVAWGQGNGPVHMIEACIWLGRSHPNWNKWVEAVLCASEKLGSNWAQVADFVRAAHLYSKGNGTAKAALEKVAETNTVAERRATALLLLFRLAVEDPPAALAYLDKIPALNEVRHVRAAVKFR